MALFVTDAISIPDHELEIKSSRAGGPGGQHVNKTSSRITIRWHIQTSTALLPSEKERVYAALGSRITSDGYLQIYNSATRSQHENRMRALAQLAFLIRKALHIPKKRTATQISQAKKERRLQKKSRMSEIKQLRKKPMADD